MGQRWCEHLGIPLFDQGVYMVPGLVGQGKLEPGMTPKLLALVWLGMAGTARLEGDSFLEGDGFLEWDGFLEGEGFLERDWLRLGCGASRQWGRLSRPLTCRAWS